MMFEMEFWNSGPGIVTTAFLITLWFSAMLTWLYFQRKQKANEEPKLPGQKRSWWRKKREEEKYVELGPPVAAIQSPIPVIAEPDRINDIEVKLPEKKRKRKK